MRGSGGLGKEEGVLGESSGVVLRDWGSWGVVMWPFLIQALKEKLKLRPVSLTRSPVVTLFLLSLRLGFAGPEKHGWGARRGGVSNKVLDGEERKPL